MPPQIATPSIFNGLRKYYATVNQRVVRYFVGHPEKTVNVLTRFLRDDNAATAVEYAVVLVVIMTAIVGIAAVGQQTGVMYDGIQTEMESHGTN